MGKAEAAGRNASIDAARVAAALLVIPIHSLPFSESAPALSYAIANSLPRLAVPYFLMITGFYLKGRIHDGPRVKKQVTKVFLTYLLWMAIYAPFYLFTFKPTMRSLASLVRFVAIDGYGPLWYLLYVPYATIFLRVLVVRLKASAAFLVALSVVLFAAGYALQALEGSLDAVPVLGLLKRLFLSPRPLIAFSIVTLAYAVPFDRPWMASRPLLIVLLAGVAAEAFAGYFLFGRPMDFLVTLIPASLLAFSAVLRSGSAPAIDPRLLKDFATGVFLLHFLVLRSLQIAFPAIRSLELTAAVLAASCLAAFALARMRARGRLAWIY